MPAKTKVSVLFSSLSFGQFVLLPRRSRPLVLSLPPIFFPLPPFLMPKILAGEDEVL